MNTSNNKAINYDIPNPANLLNWLSEMLLLKNNDRIQIVDTMLTTYIETCAEEFPEVLDDLILYLQTESHRIEFKNALNNMNLVVAMTFIAKNEQQFNQAVRLLLLESRQDSRYSQTMKLYYLNHLDKDDFSGMVFNEKEYEIISSRLSYFKAKYSSFFP